MTAFPLSRRRMLAAAGAALVAIPFAGLSLAPATGRAASRDLGGRPFSSPDEITPMPQDWRQQPIQRPPGADLALAIDQQLFPALVPLVRDFARRRGIEVALLEGTCGIASSALTERSADITGMCCPPGTLDRLPGVRYHTIGIASIALIVNPANPLQAVTLDEARRLFGGDVRNWSELPISGVAAERGRVRAVTRLHCATRPGHWRLLLDNADLFAMDIVDVPAIADMIHQVARNPQAIGYETLWHVAKNVTSGRVKTLLLDGHAPADARALAAGRYPLFRVFNVSSWTDRPAADPVAEDLVRHLVDQAPAIDPQFGIVPHQALREAGWRFEGDEVLAPPA